VILGAALVELRVNGSQSLKEKRGVVQSIKRRVRNKFNLSIAEVGGQETWQRAVLGLAAAGSSERVVRGELERALEFIEGLGLAEVSGSELQVTNLPQEESGFDWDDEEAEADTEADFGFGSRDADPTGKEPGEGEGE
jgi:hypothetical protein